jgi:hypothetical protein
VPAPPPPPPRSATAPPAGPTPEATFGAAPDAESAAEIARLHQLISSQNRAQKILEENLEALKEKLSDYDHVERRRRGSEMALASLSEQQKLMETQQSSIRAQLLESKAAHSLVQSEIGANLKQQETITSLMESHRTFTAAYEMRVAELESENGEVSRASGVGEGGPN